MPFLSTRSAEQRVFRPPTTLCSQRPARVVNCASTAGQPTSQTAGQPRRAGASRASSNAHMSTRRLVRILGHAPRRAARRRADARAGRGGERGAGARGRVADGRRGDGEVKFGAGNGEPGGREVGWGGGDGAAAAFDSRGPGGSGRRGRPRRGRGGEGAGTKYWLPLPLMRLPDGTT